MQLHPVKHAVKPSYPDKYALALHTLLNTYRPRRWQQSTVCSVALAAVLGLSLTACSPAAPQSGNTPVPGTAAPTPTSTPQMASAVPLFEHGDGVGTYGCVAVAGPIYLSEQEAFAIVESELKTAGLALQKSDKGIETKLPLTNRFRFADENAREKDLPTQKGTLAFDALVEAPAIDIEIVTKEDVEAWENLDDGMYVSVEEMEVKAAAKALSSSLGEARNLDSACAVFYDPVTTINYLEISDKVEKANPSGDQPQNVLWDQFEAEENASARAQSEDLLRAQVQDFLKWLQAEGII